MGSADDYTDFRSVQEPDIPYFTPKQSTPVGAAILDPDNRVTEDTISPVFRPLTIRGITFPNRIFVSPMCMYSCAGDGMMTDFHLVHCGQFALRGAALVTMEATAVMPSVSHPSKVGMCGLQPCVAVAEREPPNEYTSEDNV